MPRAASGLRRSLRVVFQVTAAAAVGTIAAMASWSTALAQQPPGGDNLGLELVDPKVLRVCADPANLPFSNERGEGFENKIAELVAAKLGKRLAYTWYPQSTGFVRQTLGSFRCDVIMGFPQGGDLAQSTNPYYRSVYALVLKEGSPLASVDTLGDERLRGKRLGIVAGTPPSNYLVAGGLMVTAKPYPLVVDTRFDSSGRAMTKDIASGDVDAGILWGPIAGWYARQSEPHLRVVPLLKENGRPSLAYRITMGVRPTDQNWRRELNGVIRAIQPDVTKILLSYGVPLLDDGGHIKTGEPSAAKP
jgi:quinoprotein dehydrogenase-associated probable ABC transporter substrate-binding protein